MIAYRITGHPATAIVMLSLAMNFLVLPLYRRADAMQEEARDMDNKLRKGISHIKKSFSGDEKMMILQTYYRQNNYSPINGLKGSVSLLLEIPFFIAAYQFLSHLIELHGVSLGPIANLGAPDGLITVSGLSVNVMPFIMTGINLISSAIFLKGFPLKSKIQLYGMALFFLVFLYNSPSGLVFYWTLNNIFSLVKTIFYKIPKPKLVLSVLSSAVGILIIVSAVFILHISSPKMLLLFLALGLGMQVPVIWPLLKKHLPLGANNFSEKEDKKVFLLSAAFISVLTGIFIPSGVIASSPLEFINSNYFFNPALYVLNSCCLAFGTFFVWFNIFYRLSSSGAKHIFSRLMAIACFVMAVNHFCFSSHLGTLSPSLVFVDEEISLSRKTQMLNLAVLAGIFIVGWLLSRKKLRLIGNFVSIMLVACLGIGVWNTVNISRSVSDYKELSSSVVSDRPEMTLSKTQNNVIVFMLDRAMGEYIPYIFNEKPELKEQFDGFTYYSNVISFGGATNFGVPPLFGGYEYVPLEMNRKDDQLLVEKHNESIKLLPVLFDEKGYDVSICDIPYANYSWISDYSIYSDYPDISCYYASGKFTDPETSKAQIETNKRNFFCYSLMTCLPSCTQGIIYNSGEYNKSASENFTQVMETPYTSKGLDILFMDSYNIMSSLNEMTVITEDTPGFSIMCNNITHEPMLLQEPGYTPAMNVDNSSYYVDLSRFTLDGRTLLMENNSHVAHYHVNMAAMLQLAKWFDYLRENDVYDNTRIILVSDHGRNLRQMSDLILDDANSTCIEPFFPLLMVKDFNSTGFTFSDTFMTQADVPGIALEGLIENATNPFTGNAIDNSAKDQLLYLTNSTDFQTTINNGYSFLPSTWLTMSDNIWDKSNWTVIDEVCTLPQ